MSNDGGQQGLSTESNALSTPAAAPHDGADTTHPDMNCDTGAVLEQRAPNSNPASGSEAMRSAISNSSGQAVDSQAATNGPAAQSPGSMADSVGEKASIGDVATRRSGEAPMRGLDPGLHDTIDNGREGQLANQLGPAPSVGLQTPIKRITLHNIARRLAETIENGGMLARKNSRAPEDEPSGDSAPWYQGADDDRRTPSPQANPHPVLMQDQIWVERVRDIVKLDLFTTTVTHDRTQPKRCILNMASLLRVAALGRQSLIAQEAKKLLAGSSGAIQDTYDIAALTTLQQHLHEYCEVIRDLEFMQQCSATYANDEHDPFLMSSSRTIDRMIMEAASLIPAHVLPQGDLPPPSDANAPRLPFTGRHSANEKAKDKRRLLRLAMAIVGGLFLIAPMLIMVFVRSRAASVSTTCGAIVLASLALAFLTDLGPNEVLATCAAYAAVLVVFVGTSLPVIDPHAPAA